ncbi:MAG: hypothetical protein P8K79_12655 [Mariniblastus sp.]|nr:hypothetical protein [Mariniblastus sp.]
MNRSVYCLLFLILFVSAEWAEARQQSDQKSDQAVSSAVEKQDTDKQTRAKARAEKQRRKKKVADEMAHFLRIRRDAKRRPVAMETSVTRYEGVNEKGEPVSVDLIGVVHIGEKTYYEQLNKVFENYDAMLYELVAPEGTVIPKGGRVDSGASANPLVALQVGMKSMLELDFQLDHIDYTKDNFVHADMSPNEFAESMKRNDESFFKMAMKAIGQSMGQQSSGQDAKMLAAILSGSAVKRRAVMAEQMQDLESGMVIFEGRDGSTIIDFRNAKAMDILKREIAAGNKKLALFYGAGHLPDMQRRLQSEFQMKRAGQYWLEAWKLK